MKKSIESEPKKFDWRQRTVGAEHVDEGSAKKLDELEALINEGGADAADFLVALRHFQSDRDPVLQLIDHFKENLTLQERISLQSAIARAKDAASQSNK